MMGYAIRSAGYLCSRLGSTRAEGRTGWDLRPPYSGGSAKQARLPDPSLLGESASPSLVIGLLIFSFVKSLFLVVCFGRQACPSLEVKNANY